MSFEVVFHGFNQGRESAGGGAAARAVLDPWVDYAEPEYQHLAILYGDGGADVHIDEGDASGMVVSRVAGIQTWDLVLAAAQAAGWVALFDEQAGITDESQRQHLPPDLRDSAVLITSGAELLDVT